MDNSKPSVEFCPLWKPLWIMRVDNREFSDLVTYAAKNIGE